MSTPSLEEQAREYRADPDVQEALSALRRSINIAWMKKDSHQRLVESCRDPEKLAEMIAQLDARLKKLEGGE